MAEEVVSVLLVGGGADEDALVECLLGGAARSYAVTRAATLADARRELAAAPPDCLVLDLAAPDVGRALPVDAVGALTQAAPVVVLMGASDAAGATVDGADDCIERERLDAGVLDRSIRYAIERRAAREAVARSALHDALTGLPSRRLLEDRFAHTLERAERSGTRVAVVFLDVDRLVTVNHAAGHGAGDAVLVELARRLRTRIRAADTLARHAGDEFVAVWEDVAGERDAVGLARRLLDAFDAPVVVDGQAFALTASAGLAIAEPGDDPGRVLRDAHTAMYRAKRRGGGRLELFDETMRLRVVGAARDEQALRDALAQGALDVRYEPIVHAETGAVWGAEAVVTWARPERGEVPAAEIMALAGRARLDAALTEWLLRRCCRQVATWLAEEPGAVWTRISVGLPPEQLRREALAEVVAGALTRSGVEGDRLRLEVDETELAAPEVAANLTRLCATGVSVLVDDFGTGASSLGVLRRLPIKQLKVGGALVGGLAGDPAAERIVEAVSSMAEAFGLEVTATGVATLDALRAAAELRLPWLQGPAISPPLPADAFAGWVRDARGVEALSRAGVARGATASGEVTLVEAAEVLGVSVSTVRRWADSGRLASTRTPGGHRRVRRADLQRMARASRGPAVLRSARIPERALPLAGGVLADVRADLPARLAAALYERPGDSWLGDAAGTSLAAAWLDALGAALRSGRYGALVTETQRLLRHARLAGATPLECHLFLETAGAAVARALRRRAPDAREEGAEVQRLCRALAQVIESEG